MEKLIKELCDIVKDKKLSFDEPFYLSKDEKTAMGEVSFKNILLLPYRDTEAGSNPREYTGLAKRTNITILRSLLENGEYLFRFLHSGIILCLINPIPEDKKYLKYSECCLTNGNQTRYIILILTLIKLMFKEETLENITNEKYITFIKENFCKNDEVYSMLDNIKYTKINQVITNIKSHPKQLENYNKIKIDKFLNAKIRIQVNLITNIVSDLKEKNENYIGTLIAEANNDTQNVKADDIFGNKNKNVLRDKLFNEFIEKNKNEIKIEYKFGEVDKNHAKVHILTLLRPIVATGILTKEKDIYNFTNQRTPVYNLFSKLLSKSSTHTKTVTAVSKLIPFLYDLRIKYLEPDLESLHRDQLRELKKRAFAGELNSPSIGMKIHEAGGQEEIIEKIIKSVITYNEEHIFPVLIYRIRKLFKTNINNELDLTIPTEKRDEFFKTILESIYKKYIDIKLSGMLPTSLTTVVRDNTFYEYGSETYTALKNVYKLEETNYIEENKIIIT